MVAFGGLERSAFSRIGAPVLCGWEERVCGCVLSVHANNSLLSFISTDREINNVSIIITEPFPGESIRFAKGLEVARGYFDRKYHEEVVYRDPRERDLASRDRRGRSSPRFRIFRICRRIVRSISSARRVKIPNCVIPLASLFWFDKYNHVDLESSRY